MTRSLGHNFTDIEPQKHFIECSTDDEVKVIIISDGIGDMLCMDSDIEILNKYSAEELVNFAEARWKQEWYWNETSNTKIKFPINGYDDCSCSVWWHKKI